MRTPRLPGIFLIASVATIPPGSRQFDSDLVSFVFQCQHLCQSLDAELRRGVRASQSFPFLPCGEEILMITPPPCGRMILRASRLHRECSVEIGVENFAPDI